MKAPLFAAVGMLAASACSAGQPDPANAANAVQPAAEAKPPAAPGKPVELRSETPLITWEAAWPAEVNAIPALEKLIREPAEKALAEYTRDAREDKARREKEGFDFNGYEYSVNVEVAGQTPRLLSLTRDWMSYSGGAHPNHGTQALLWDKDANALVPLAKLLGSATLESLYQDAYCKALDAQRAEKREGLDAASDPDDPFSQCPKFSELQIVPKGPEQGGPMTVLLFHADPYVAGPYVEGDYDVELAVTAALVAALKPAFRSSFAAAR